MLRTQGNVLKSDSVTVQGSVRLDAAQMSAPVQPGRTIAPTVGPQVQIVESCSVEKSISTCAPSTSSDKSPKSMKPTSNIGDLP